MTEGGENPPVVKREEHHLATHSEADIQVVINLLKDTDFSIEKIAKLTNSS